jgi:hypothetical protein
MNMTIPGNMWLYDDGGALIKGGCDVEDREFSIEFKGFHHNLAIPTDRTKPGEAIKGTSVVSKYGRMLLRNARTPFGIRVPTPVGIRMQKTNNLAAVIARYVPWLGWVGLVNSIYQVSRSTQKKYNLIVRPKDRIQWTSF